MRSNPPFGISRAERGQFCANVPKLRETKWQAQIRVRYARIWIMGSGREFWQTSSLKAKQVPFFSVPSRLLALRNDVTLQSLSN